MSAAVRTLFIASAKRKAEVRKATAQAAFDFFRAIACSGAVVAPWVGLANIYAVRTAYVARAVIIWLVSTTKRDVAEKERNLLPAVWITWPWRSVVYCGVQFSLATAKSLSRWRLQEPALTRWRAPMIVHLRAKANNALLHSNRSMAAERSWVNLERQRLCKLRLPLLPLHLPWDSCLEDAL